MKTAGFDPGANGCLACTSDGKDVQALRFKGRSILEMRYEIADMLSCLSTNDQRPKVYGELTGFRSTDVQSDKIHGIIKMERNAGKIQGALEVLGFSINWTNQWQLEFGLGGISNYEDRKKAAHKLAKEEFGNWITKDAADGILICVYGWRKEHGGLTHGKKKGFIARPGAGVLYTKRSSR